MSAKQIGSALEWLRHLVGGLENENESELLEKYVRDHDARAFEELAKRHAPMVMSVCRRILGNHADAEDAFQAVLNQSPVSSVAMGCWRGSEGCFESASKSK